MIDIQNDENLEYFSSVAAKVANKEALTLIKSASVDFEYDDIIDDGFADSENRAFPVFTPELAIISSIYAEAQGADEMVKTACKEALNDWGYGDLEIALIEKTASAEEIPEDMFLLPGQKKLPVVNEETLNKSAHALKTGLGNLDLAERVEGCSRLFKMAEEYGIDPVDLGKDVISYAQEAPCSLSKLANSLQERYALTHNQGYKDILLKVAKDIDENSTHIFDKSYNSEIALNVIKLDKEAGIYGEIEDGVLTVFNSPFAVDENGNLEKSATVATMELGGYILNEDNLEKIARDEFSEEFPGLEKEVFDGDTLNVDRLFKFAESIDESSRELLGAYLYGR